MTKPQAIETMLLEERRYPPLFSGGVIRLVEEFLEVLLLGLLKRAD